jgi:hypothetical protein
MKNVTLLSILFSLFILSCNSSINPNINKPSEIEIKANSESKTEIKTVINPEFYSIILKNQFSQGGIQGAKLTSHGLLMSEYFDGSESLEFIFKCKMELESYFELFDESKSSLKSLEEKFECSIFKVNMVLNKNPEDEFDLYKYVFPQIVKIFTLEDGIWKLSNQKKVNSFEELGELKYETVYKK